MQRPHFGGQDLEEVPFRDPGLDFHIRETLLSPKPPELQNTDGDSLELTTLRFALTMPVVEAFERVLALAAIGGDQHVSYVDHDVSGAMTHVEISWVKAGNRKHAGAHAFRTSAPSCSCRVLTRSVFEVRDAKAVTRGSTRTPRT